MNIADVAKVVLLAVVLLVLAIAGIGCLVRPDWGIKYFGSIHLRAGGDLRREWNRVQVQLVGLAITVFVLYLVFHIIHG